MIPVVPIIVAIAAAAGGGILGYIFGDAHAQAEIERLTKAVNEYAAIAKRSEIKINELERKNHDLEIELEMIKNSRGFFTHFMVFVKGEYPEVLERFNEIEKNRKAIKIVQEEIKRSESVVKNTYLEIKEKYPDAVESWEKDNNVNTPTEWM